MKRLDLIIDALEEIQSSGVLKEQPWSKWVQALAAARSLRELEPVAWRVGGINFHTQDVAKAQSHTKKQPLFPLYALGDEK